MKQYAARPLWRLEDLLVLCFQQEELRRALKRKYPMLAPEIPELQDSPAQFAHKIVALLDRHGSIDAPLFAHLLTSRPLRRAQIMSAARALSVDDAAIEGLMGEEEQTRTFRSPGAVEPRMVDDLESLVLEREHASPGDPRCEALSEDIERLAAQIRARRPARAGDRVAGTILEYVIGRGTFGMVWHSHDAETGASRATKIFDLSRLTDGVMLWRFRRSIRALQTLHNYRGAPHSIVRVFGVADDGLAFAMDYLPRGSLENIATRNWTISERLAVFNDICSAVMYAHQAGVIHRDIKPSNVMLDANYRPVLIDFDIAEVKFLTEQKLTAGGLGTPMFAAPEQMECAGEVDERADIYSLGRLLHYTLIERVPNYSEQDALLENLSRFPPSLALTVKKATQRRAVDRYSSVSQLRRDVEMYKTGWVAVQANLRKILHRIRRNAVLVILASSVTTGSLLHADQQRELAQTHQQYEVKSRERLRTVEELAARLAQIQQELELARKEHQDLKRLLDEAKLELLKLEERAISSAPKDSQESARRRFELRGQIADLEVRLNAAQRQLDKLTQEMRDTLTLLKEVSKADGLTLPEQPAPTIVLAEAARRFERPTPLVEHPMPVVEKRVRRPKKPPEPVEWIIRHMEVENALKKIEPTFRSCAKGDSVDIIRIALIVDQAGKVVRFKAIKGDPSEKTHKCMEAAVNRLKFKRIKGGASPIHHNRDYDLM